MAEAQALKEANGAQVDSQTQIAIRQNELSVKKSELTIISQTRQADADAAYEIQRQEQQKNEAIAEGVQSLLRESIVANYNRYADKGFCPIYAKDSIKRVYHAYHDLGGNDVATELYKKLIAMPAERGTDEQ